MHIAHVQYFGIKVQ